LYKGVQSLLASIYFSNEYDWTAVEREYKRVIEFTHAATLECFCICCDEIDMNSPSLFGRVRACTEQQKTMLSAAAIAMYTQ
jgi:hypothetical protein